MSKRRSMHEIWTERRGWLCDELRRLGRLRRQTRFYLRVDDCYCFFGVACEVYRKRVNRGHWRQVGMCASGGIMYGFDLNAGCATREMPLAVQTWFGFTTTDGSYCGGRWSLMARNDDQVDFFALARTIEQKPRGLFIDDKRRAA